MPIPIKGELLLDTSAAEKDLAKLRETADKVFTVEKIEQVKGGLGDLKDIFERTGHTLFGLEQKTVDAGVAMGDLLEKGVGVGALFGPWGAILGGVVGGALGLFSERARQAAEEEQEMAARTRALVGDLSALNKKLGDFNDVDLGDLAKEIGTIKERFEDVRLGALGAAQASLLWEMISRKSAQGVSDAISAALFTDGKTRPLKAVADDIIETEKALAALGKSIDADIAKGFTVPEEDLARAKELILTLEALKQERDKAKAAEEARIQAHLDAAKADEDAAKAAGEAAAEAGRATAEEWARASEAFGALLEKEKEERAERAAATEKEIVEKGIAFREDRERYSAETWFELERKRTEHLASEEEKRQAILEQAIADSAARAQEAVAKFAPVGQLAGAIFDKVSENVSKNEKAFAGLGKTVRGTLSDILKTYAKKWVLQGGEALAQGLFMLGNPLTAAFAPQSFAAAGQYFAIAAAAGLGGIALGKGLSAPEAGAGAAGGGGAASSAGFAGPRDPGPQTLSTVNVYFQSTVPPTFEQQAQIGRELRGYLGAADQGPPPLQGGF